MDKITGKFKKIIFDGNNGYKVLLFRVKTANDEIKDIVNTTITINGYFHETNLEESFELTGNYVLNEKYGYQFQVSSYKKEEIVGVNKVEEFLSSPFIKGCGEKTAKKIVEVLGENAISLIKEDKNNLFKVGISESTAEKIYKSIMDYYDSDETIMFLKNLIVSVISIVMVNFLFLLFFEIPIARKLNKWNHSTNRQQLLKYFKVNTTICIFTFLTMCLSNAPKYAIDVYLTDEIQAVFGIIIMPATVMILVCNFITNPILIQIANLFNTNKVKDIFKLFKKIILIIFLIGMFGLVVAYLLGIPFLNIIYSSDFNKYKLELMIIILGSIFYAISMICSSFLTSIRKISIQLYMNIIFTLLAFAISFQFVKTFGITGGAISYSAVMFIRMLCYIIVTIKKLKGKE